MEPERKIEKLLKAYAKKRRGQSGGPFELHPATRRLLHGEAARNAPREDGEDSPSLWQLFRQQWAFLLAFAFCIFLVATLFLPVVFSAKHKAVSETSPAQLTVAMDNKAAPSTAGGGGASAVATAAPITTPPVTFGGLQNNAIPAGELNQTYAAQPTVMPNAFMNTYTPFQNTPVLSNFQVQQNGSVIRIVDQDGSVYEGSLQMGNLNKDNGVAQNNSASLGSAQNFSDNIRNASSPPAGALQNQVQSQAAMSQNQFQNSQNYSFSVNGLNRTLNQNVVFNGSLLANGSSAANLPQSLYRNVDQSAHLAQNMMKPEITNQMEPLPWSNLRIAGTAIINNTNLVQINAAPIAPLMKVRNAP